MLPEQRVAKYRKSVEAGTERKFATLDDLMISEVVYLIPPFPDFLAIEPLKEFIGNFQLAFPEDFKIEEDIIAGDVTVHRWSASGTFTGLSALLPGLPTGRRGTGTGCHILHWRGDKCAEIWHFGDWLGWLQKVGVLPSLTCSPTAKTSNQAK